MRLSIEVLENLVRRGALVGRDDKIDVAAPTPIQWMIGNACRVDPERSQLVAPRHRSALIVEGADGLPPLKPRIVDRHRRVFGRTTKSSREPHWHEPTPRRWAGHLFSAQGRACRASPQASAPRPWGARGGLELGRSHLAAKASAHRPEPSVDAARRLSRSPPKTEARCADWGPPTATATCDHRLERGRQRVLEAAFYHCALLGSPSPDDPQSEPLS